MSPREWFGVVDELASLARPYPILVLTLDGDLNRRVLTEVLDYSAIQGVEVALSLLTSFQCREGFFEDVAQRGVKSIWFGLDRASVNTHETSRRSRGKSLSIVESIRSARRAGVRVNVKTSVTSANVEELAELGVELKLLGVNGWEVRILGESLSESNTSTMSDSQSEDVVYFLRDVARYGMAVRIIASPPFTIELSGVSFRGSSRSRADGLQARLCATLESRLGTPSAIVGTIGSLTREGPGAIFVAASGNVYVSENCTVPIGNVRDRGILHWYREYPYPKASNFTELCSTCTQREQSVLSHIRWELSKTGWRRRASKEIRQMQSVPVP